ncbi:putative polyketide cyclase dehydrase protein [Eutypa lata UCREL1]|uniref:Putative polyketide cyclase dehydrase protein n=1 Tax=Eutypa lata (strain UCR-EL1) TaxID=1287681 RepID=M7SSC1_EUTLA|nr:putative polyketide cyclase dehydrase protein [Eutypa lata UCREL1]
MAETIGPNQEPKYTDSVLPTPTYGPGGWMTVACSTAIAAPPATCLAIMLDPSTYPSWNRWIPRATMEVSKKSSSPTATATTPASLLARKPPHKLFLLGTKFQFEVHMDPDSPRGRTSDLEITVLEDFERGGRQGLRVAWKLQGDHWYLRAERTQEFLERSDGGSDYVCYETFFGPVAPVVKLATGSALLNGFGLWMSGLKKAAEDTAREEKEKEKEEKKGEAAGKADLQ